MEKDPVKWYTRGVDKIHTLPDKAVVLVKGKGKNAEIKVWVDDEGYAQFSITFKKDPIV